LPATSGNAATDWVANEIAEGRPKRQPVGGLRAPCPPRQPVVERIRFAERKPELLVMDPWVLAQRDTEHP